jgi:hypothetical protein
MIVWSGWGVLSVLMLLLGTLAAVGAFFAKVPGHPV